MDIIDKIKKRGWNLLDKNEQNLFVISLCKHSNIDVRCREVLLNEVLYKDFGTFYKVDQKVNVGLYSKSHKVFYREFYTNNLWLMDWQEDKFSGYCYDFSYSIKEYAQ